MAALKLCGTSQNTNLIILGTLLVCLCVLVCVYVGVCACVCRCQCLCVVSLSEMSHVLLHSASGPFGGCPPRNLKTAVTSCWSLCLTYVIVKTCRHVSLLLNTSKIMQRIVSVLKVLLIHLGLQSHGKSQDSTIATIQRTLFAFTQFPSRYVWKEKEKRFELDTEILHNVFQKPVCI